MDNLDTLQLPLHQSFVANVFQCQFSIDLLDKISTWPLVPINAHVPDALEPHCRICEACKEVETLKREEQLIMAETAAQWSKESSAQRVG